MPIKTLSPATLAIFLLLILSKSCSLSRALGWRSRLAEDLSTSSAYQDEAEEAGKSQVGLRLVRPDWRRATFDREPSEPDLAASSSLSRSARGKPATFAYAMSPISNQLLGVDRSADDANTIWASRYKPAKIAYGELSSCVPIKTGVQFDKDEVDLESGRVRRTCRGTAQVNRCEGRCASIVEPSAKSPRGLKKVSRVAQERVSSVKTRLTTSFLLPRFSVTTLAIDYAASLIRPRVVTVVTKAPLELSALGSTSAI